MITQDQASRQMLVRRRSIWSARTSRCRSRPRRARRLQGADEDIVDCGTSQKDHHCQTAKTMVPHVIPPREKESICHPTWSIPPGTEPDDGASSRGIQDIVRRLASRDWQLLQIEYQRSPWIAQGCGKISWRANGDWLGAQRRACPRPGNLAAPTGRQGHPATGPQTCSSRRCRFGYAWRASQSLSG